jgi:hypothetical protein
MKKFKIINKIGIFVITCIAFSSSSYAQSNNITGIGNDRIITPEGESVFLGGSYREVMLPLIEKINSIKIEDQSNYELVMKSMIKTASMRDIIIDPSIFFGGKPSVVFIEGIDNSDDFYQHYYEYIRETGKEGVTVKNIISMGNSHQANGIVKFRNALKLFMPEFKKRKIKIDEKNDDLQSFMGRVSIIRPVIYNKNGSTTFDARIINDSGVGIKELVVTFQIINNNHKNTDLKLNEEYNAKIFFEKPLKNEEFRTIRNLAITVDDKLPIDKISISLTVVGLTSLSGWEITGSEYDDALAELNKVEKAMSSIDDNIPSIVDIAINEAYSRISN